MRDSDWINCAQSKPIISLWTEPLQGIEMVVLVIVIEDSLMDGVYKYMGNNQSTCECTKDK